MRRTTSISSSTPNSRPLSYQPKVYRQSNASSQRLGTSNTSNNKTYVKQVINPDRTMSLTTTTVRTFGSYQLVSTKTTPIRPLSKPKSSRPKRPRVPGYASSLLSMESDLDSVLEEEDFSQFNHISNNEFNDSNATINGQIVESPEYNNNLLTPPKANRHSGHRISFSPVTSVDDDSLVEKHRPNRSLSPMKSALKMDHSRNSSMASNINEAGLYPQSSNPQRHSKVSFSSNDAINEFKSNHPPSIKSPSSQQTSFSSVSDGSPKRTRSTSSRFQSAPSPNPSKILNAAASAAAVSAANAKKATAAVTEKRGPAAPSAVKSKALASKRNSAIKQRPSSVASNRDSTYDDQNYSDDDSSSGNSIYSDASAYPDDTPSGDSLGNSYTTTVTTNSSLNSNKSQPLSKAQVTAAAASFASQKHAPQKPQIASPSLDAAAAARNSSVKNAASATTATTTTPTTTITTPKSHSYRALAGDDLSFTLPTQKLNGGSISRKQPSPAAVPAQNKAKVPSTKPTPQKQAFVSAGTSNDVIKQNIHSNTLQKLNGKYDNDEELQPYVPEDNTRDTTNNDNDDVISVSSESSWKRERSAAPKPAFKHSLRGTVVSTTPAVTSTPPTAPFLSVPTEPLRHKTSGSSLTSISEAHHEEHPVKKPSQPPKTVTPKTAIPKTEIPKTETPIVYSNLEPTLSDSSFDKERANRRKNKDGKVGFKLHSFRDPNPVAQEPIQPTASSSGRFSSLSTRSQTSGGLAAASGAPLTETFKSRFADSDSDFDVVVDTEDKPKPKRRDSFTGGLFSGLKSLHSNDNPSAAAETRRASSSLGFRTSSRMSTKHATIHEPEDPSLEEDDHYNSLQTSMSTGTEGSPKHSKLNSLFARRQHVMQVQQERAQKTFHSAKLKAQNSTLSTEEQTKLNTDANTPIQTTIPPSFIENTKNKTTNSNISSSAAATATSYNSVSSPVTEIPYTASAPSEKFTMAALEPLPEHGAHKKKKFGKLRKVFGL